MSDLIHRSLLRKELSKLPSDMGFISKSAVMQTISKQKCQKAKPDWMMWYWLIRIISVVQLTSTLLYHDMKIKITGLTEQLPIGCRCLKNRFIQI